MPLRNAQLKTFQLFLYIIEKINKFVFAILLYYFINMHIVIVLISVFNIIVNIHVVYGYTYYQDGRESVSCSPFV